ncbi:hypothetical protein Vafri_5718, partial [Volvox africanus]
QEGSPWGKDRKQKTPSGTGFSSHCIQTAAVHSKVSMIQKPSLKNGQKIINDVTSKTSSVEPQQQQQHRKGERPSHVQDVAKNGNGGYHQSASHGVVNGQVENGRSNPANGSSGLAHAPQNGTHGRLNANGHPGAKPGSAANGNARPQPFNGTYSARPGGKPSSHGSNGGDSKQPVAGPSVQPAAGGGRGRDSGAFSDAHPNGGAAAVDNGIVVGNGGFYGAAAGRPREAKRRSGRGHGATGPEGAPAGADTAANGTGGAGGASGGGPQERQMERPGRPRGDRRSRGPANEVADTNGGTATIASGPVTANGARSTVEHDDAERGGQRGGRPRGRRGRGAQQAGPAEGVEAGDEMQRMAPFLQPTADGSEMQQGRIVKQPRQRPFGARRPSSQTGASEGNIGENFQTVPTDGQQNAGGKHQRRGREPKQSQYQSDDAPKQKPQDAQNGERDGDQGSRGSRARSGRRRNGGGQEIEAATIPGPVATTDWDGGAGGRRQRPPRPPRQAQQPYQQQLQQPYPRQPSVLVRDLPRAAPSQQEVELPPAPATSHLHYQSPVAVPASSNQQVAHQSQEALSQGSTHVPPPPPPPPPQPQQPQEPMAQQQPQQHQYPPLPFPEGQPLLDFPHHQHLHMHHMLPQHQYPPPHDYQQQQHFLQQHQYDPAFQQFQQQLLQQHLAPPGPGAHGFMPVPYNAPGGPMGGPAPMPPAFFAPGVNAYGQVLGPAPGPNFGGAPAPSHVQESGMPPSVPAPHHIPPQEIVASVQRLQLDEPISEAAFPTVASLPPQQEEQCLVADEPKPAPAAKPAVPEAAAVSVTIESEVKVVNAPAPVNDVPSSEPVKNEWADRLAQQALARMNAVKSSLLSGTSGLSEGVRATTGADERPRSSVLARPTAYSNGSVTGSAGYTTSPRGGSLNSNDSESWRGYGDDRRSGGNVAGLSSETWRNGAASNGAPSGDAANGWRASLAPTGVADAAEAWRTRSRPEIPPDAQVPPNHQPREESPPQPTGATSFGSGRPRLNLQPRTKPLPAQTGTPPAAGGDIATATANGSVAVTAPGTGAVATASNTRSSIFGAARPREEVLRERGVTDSERLTASNIAYANGCGMSAVSGGSRMGGFAGSVTSGGSDEDQWQTVGKGGRSKPPPSSADVGNALLDAASDPFFTGRTTTGHGVAIVGRSIPSGRVYNSGIAQYGSGSYGKASYGSHGAGGDTYMNAYGASRGYSHANDDDEPFFKRSLPTRNDGPF